MTFQEIGLNSDLLKAVADLGFETPTPIQEQTILLLAKQETDMVALAQTGTGKTAAFGLPILNSINCDNKTVQALILAPTRELCVQITNDIKNYGKYLKGFNVTAIYGGARIDGQIKDIKRGVQVVVATPGRLIDMIERRLINLNTVKTVVLEEADEMLNSARARGTKGVPHESSLGKTVPSIGAPMVVNEYIVSNREYEYYIRHGTSYSPHLPGAALPCSRTLLKKL